MFDRSRGFFSTAGPIIILNEANLNCGVLWAAELCTNTGSSLKQGKAHAIVAASEPLAYGLGDTARAPSAYDKTDEKQDSPQLEGLPAYTPAADGKILQTRHTQKLHRSCRYYQACVPSLTVTYSVKTAASPASASMEKPTRRPRICT